MRYRVRTPEGELEYPSLRDVEQAYMQGLVAPQDEVLEEGATLWRKAESLPSLVRARRASTAAGGRAQTLTVLAAVALGGIALYLLSTGANLLWVFALAILVISILSRVVIKAFRRPPPR
ncbi:hypothetical protein [Hyalangium rubrum]|uniref:GYF domain-containing protein n=1 Tax=Hyalangium rubrum TaxID=3103134 RepID=A0ABU5GUX9_9BACT|nr:hypothetical protein [Hyalangium sp. s54d21]MDY7224975.1 hypothetical protein [Hyalangium sp. s54d21]